MYFTPSPKKTDQAVLERLKDPGNAMVEELPA